MSELGDQLNLMYNKEKGSGLSHLQSVVWATELVVETLTQPEKNGSLSFWVAQVDEGM